MEKILPLTCLAVMLVFTGFSANASTDSSQNISRTPDIEEVKDTVKQRSGFSRFMRKVITIPERAIRRGIDTNYVSVPERSFMVAAIYSTNNVNTTMVSPEIKETSYPSIKTYLNIPITQKGGLAISYRNLALSYYRDLTSYHSNQFIFSINKRKFGVEITAMSMFNIPASISYDYDGEHYVFKTNGGSEATEGNLPGGVSKLNLTLSTYIILSGGDRFSGPAMLKNSAVQKRTAGAFFAQARYNYVKLDATECSVYRTIFNYDWYVLSNNQINLGVGYGINIVPGGGKFTIHFSATPLMVLSFNSKLDVQPSEIIDPDPQAQEYYRKLAENLKKLSDKASNKTSFDFSANAMVAVNCNISSRFVAFMNAYYTYNSFGSKDTFSVSTHNITTNLGVGFRF